MQPTILKRSTIISGHKTSVSLEAEFWNALKEIAQSRGITIADLIASIDEDREGNLSSAIRLYVLAHYRYEIMCNRN